MLADAPELWVRARTRPSLHIRIADLEAWLAALDHPRKADVAALVAIALAARSGIAGHIEWNAPSFIYAGDDRVTPGEGEVAAEAEALGNLIARWVEAAA
jgi:hypothetical protein